MLIRKLSVLMASAIARASMKENAPYEKVVKHWQHTDRVDIDRARSIQLRTFNFFHDRYLFFDFPLPT